MAENTIAPEDIPKTPPRLGNPCQPHAVSAMAVSSTPRRDRLPPEAFQTGTSLEVRRDGIVEQLDPVPIVSMDFLYDSALNWSIMNDSDYLDTVETTLKKAGTLANGRWVDYPTTPSEMEGNEDIVFLPLLKIIREITAATVKATKGTGVGTGIQTLRFDQKPHEVPHGERENATRPDISGYILDRAALRSLLPQFRTSSWFALAVPAELKKRLLPVTALDDVKKIIWSAKHILANDPARRHVFGFTTENSSMTIWFMSRSHILASEPLDFISSPRELIRAVSTFSCASAEQLGFDSTISQYKKNKTVQYKIVLNGITYMTIRPLADHRADKIQGRATRVWLVHPKGKPNVRYVCKDVWMPKGSLAEGDQLRRLREALKSMDALPGMRRPPSDYFLTVVDDGFVPLSDGSFDDTLSTMGDKTVPSDSECVQLSPEPSEPKRKNASGSHTLSRSRGTQASETLRHTNRGLPPIPSLATATPAGHKYHAPRQHYRIIFAEVGTSIYELQTIAQVMSALEDGIQAIRILSSLGLVHRDISPANLLVANGVARLTDLEYLKVFREDAKVPGLGHDPTTVAAGPREDKTGTAIFMAFEVQRNGYAYAPAERMNKDTGAMEAVDRTKAPFSFFHHNPLHDLESAVWIAIWVIINSSCESDGTLRSTQSDQWKMYFGPDTAERSWNRRQAIEDTHHLVAPLFPPEFVHAVESVGCFHAYPSSTAN
ncbi:hypothetical protein C8R47DRAFT_729780 [Mycena vitilis]|nr:hypothetical protein C8R47DRAFT_729780 [Mycena vitilis]